MKKWPGIIKRKAINVAKGLKQFVIGIGKVIKSTPKAIYMIGRYIVTRLWKGIKAIPKLLRLAGEQIWLGLKTSAIFLRDLFFRYFISNCH